MRSALVVLAAAAMLAGCGSTVAVSAADPTQSVAPGQLPVGISLGAQGGETEGETENKRLLISHSDV